MDDRINKVLFAMGLDPSCADLGVVEYFLDEWGQVFPDNNCLIMHNTVVSLYEYLIKASAPNASGGGRRREVQGKRQIELDNYDKSKDWQNALDSYLNSPWTAFPSCRDELSGSSGLGRVIIGGVDETKIQQINNDVNIRTGGASEVGGVTNPLNGARTVPKGWNLVRPWGSGWYGK